MTAEGAESSSVQRASERPGRVFAEEGRWLFSRRVDLLAFGGSALASALLVALGAQLGLLAHDASLWSFWVCVVAIDVAHVWATGFRVYFDRAELRARPLLYFGLPALAYLGGVAVHALSALAFWRVLAYIAVFHFLRQQAGFMALYARRSPLHTPLDALVDRAAIYAAMLYPLVYWHLSLPRRFHWFVEGDFVSWFAGQSEHVAYASLLRAVAGLFTLVALGAFAARQLLLLRRGQAVLGKSLLLSATLGCWYGGIVLCDSDYVFTVTNVLLHGVPYFVLTHRYARARERPSFARRVSRLGLAPFVFVCIALAFAEEALWDRWVWHEHTQLFGAHPALSPATLLFITPLLAVPQLTHYLLDGFVWRVRSENPVLRRELEA